MTLAQTFSKADVKFVISRFQESLQDLCFLTSSKHIVYNRGDVSALMSTCGFHSEERLENVGREAFLYLSHIVRHYNNLSPVTVFLQGDATTIRKDLSVLFEAGQITIPPENDGFAYLKSMCYSSRLPRDLDALEKHYGSPDVKQLLLNGHQALLNVNITNPRFAPNGYFLVTKEAILRRPRVFYIHLARQLGVQNDPPIGHFFERSWAEVFLSTCGMDPDKFSCTLTPQIPCI